MLLSSTKENKNDSSHALTITDVCKEIEELQEKNVIRLLDLSCGRCKESLPEDDAAVMETSVYLNCVHDAIKKEAGPMLSSKQIDDYLHHFTLITDSCKSKSLDNDSLKQVLKSKTSTYVTFYGRAGLLRKCPQSSNLYYFSLPTFGKAVKNILVGRKSFVKKLQQSLHGELLQKNLMERCKFSDLPAGFHLRDAVCRGVVKMVNSPSGETFVRLTDRRIRKY
jgi:hypothetical protein